MIIKFLLLQDISVICSVLNLTCMSMERFYAIVYPLRSRSVCTVSQARRVVAVAWLLAVVLALPRNWIQVSEQSTCKIHRNFFLLKYRT